MVSADVNTVGVTVDTMFKEKSGRTAVKDGYYTEFLDGTHCYTSLTSCASLKNTIGLLTNFVCISKCPGWSQHQTGASDQAEKHVQHVLDEGWKGIFIS